MKSIVGALLDMPPEELETSSMAWSLKWIRLQCTHGWVNHKLRANTLMPLLAAILPSLGYDKARLERRWTSLVGPLSADQSPYFKSLSKHLTLTRAQSASASASVVPPSATSVTGQDGSSSYLSPFPSQAQAQESSTSSP